jgi:hypothetical protein
VPLVLGYHGIECGVTHQLLPRCTDATTQLGLATFGRHVRRSGFQKVALTKLFGEMASSDSTIVPIFRGAY